ncbi:MAG: hypothetical protein DRR00_10715 [Candidatus Parabeggiatoa sp. nov. 3]|nr:MAG: hypothetical protein DRR00_10715 [Gammaproteobacteria bacterium]RKZ69021.1 MAG: hypothetical protein DRQ99_02175 [Gammaproteobacteria bacterium]
MAQNLRFLQFGEGIVIKLTSNGGYTHFILCTFLRIDEKLTSPNIFYNNNIGIQVAEFLFLPNYAIGIAAASYVSRFLGANRSDIARAITYRILLGITYMGVLGIPLWFFGESIARWFSADNAVVYQAGLMFKVIALFQIFNGINIILRSALSEAGDTLIPTLFLIACAAGIMFPAAILLSQLIEPGLVGAWIGAFIYLVALSVMIIYRYQSNRWIVIFSLAQK